LLRDRSNGTRGQRRRQERHPRFVTSQSFRTAPQRLNARTPGVCEPPSILKSRTDQERSPLHDVKQHAHCQASLGGRESFHLWTSDTGCCGRSLPCLRTHLLSSHRGDKVLCRSLSRNGYRPEASKTAGIMRAKQQSQPEQPSVGSRHQTMTADLVEPDGIEPTTSCLQSRRSPN
jgi:hypothetical protein